MKSKLFYTLFFLLLPLLSFNINEDYLKLAKTSFHIDTSIVYLEKLISEEKETDQHKLIEAHCLLASKYTDKGLYSKAEKLLKTALNLAKQKNIKTSEGYIYIDMGNLYKYKEDFSTSLNYYLKAYDILKNTNNTDYFVRCNIQLAEYYRKIADYKKARNYINDLFEIHKKGKIQNKDLELKLYNRAAAIENENGPAEKSIYYTKKSLEIAKNINNKYAQATSLNELGYSYKNLNKSDSAEILYKKAEEIWFNIGANKEAINAMNNRALLYAHNNFPKEKAFQLYDSIIYLVENKNIDFPLTLIYQFLHDQYAFVGDTNTAYKYMMKTHQSFMISEKKRNSVKIADVIEKYENEKVNQEKMKIENQLLLSNLALKNEKETLFKLYIFLGTGTILLAFIIFLAIKLNKAKIKYQKINYQNELLLKEIHHRVKNNLQIISSLLELQTTKVDENTKNAILEGQHRVKAMALIHKKLYQNENLAEINFQEYTEELIAALYHAFKPINKDVDFKISTNNISFDIDTAIPLGLIINELVSNSLKYAFSNTKFPKITLNLKLISKGEYLLEVEDNGHGLPKNFDINNLGEINSLGLMLVRQLTTQLFGKISYKNDDLSCFYITFKDTFTRKLED